MLNYLSLMAKAISLLYFALECWIWESVSFQNRPYLNWKNCLKKLRLNYLQKSLSHFSIRFYEIPHEGPQNFRSVHWSSESSKKLLRLVRFFPLSYLDICHNKYRLLKHYIKILFMDFSSLTEYVSNKDDWLTLTQDAYFLR